MVGTTESITPQIVDSVAEHAETQPRDLPPLYDAIDPDALDSFIANSNDGTVEFRYAECSVTVDSEGDVTVADGVTQQTASPDPVAERATR